MKIALLSVVLLMLGAAGRAETLYGSEFEFLPRGARADGMGGTGCTDANDAFGLFYNPAVLQNLRSMALILEYTPIWNLGDDYTSGAFARPFKGDFALGVGYSRLEINDIPYFETLQGSSLQDRNNNIALPSTEHPLSTFYTTYELFNFSLAKWYRTRISQEAFYKLTIPVIISGGAGIKFYRQRFSFAEKLDQPDYEGMASDIDGGVLLAFVLDKALATLEPLKIFRVGYSLKNILGTDITYNTSEKYRDSGERIRTLGFSYLNRLPFLQGGFILALDLVKRRDEQIQRFGAEYFFRDLLFLRGGLFNGGYSAGVGFKYRWIGVDYAFRGHELSNTPYRLSLTVHF
jgi:hypothetical protein